MFYYAVRICVAICFMVAKLFNFESCECILAGKWLSKKTITQKDEEEVPRIFCNFERIIGNAFKRENIRACLFLLECT